MAKVFSSGNIGNTELLPPDYFFQQNIGHEPWPSELEKDDKRKIFFW
jgi:hypothetical protein